MTSVTDQSVIDFFTRDLTRARKKQSTEGEVPERFRQSYFRMSIGGEMWVSPNPVILSKLSARVYMKKPGAKDFEVVMTTETVQGESNPNFITRLDFEPLEMENSQRYATDTIVRIEGLLNEKPFCSVLFKLADLLWELKIDAPIQATSTFSRAFKRSLAKGTIHVDLTDARKSLQAVDFHQVHLTFQIAPCLWKLIPERKILLAVSTGAAKGRWSRLFLSEVLCKPFNNLASCTFDTIKLYRGDLTCYNAGHPIRVELFGYRRGHNRPLGFCQFSIDKLASQEFLPWTRVTKSNVSLDMRIRQWVTEVALSRIQFTISAQRNRSSGFMRLSSVGSGTFKSIEDRIYGRMTPGMPRASGRLLANGDARTGPQYDAASSASEENMRRAGSERYVVRFPEDDSDISEQMYELKL